jgi:hypothetical protein
VSNIVLLTVLLLLHNMLLCYITWYSAMGAGLCCACCISAAEDDSSMLKEEAKLDFSGEEGLGRWVLSKLSHLLLLSITCYVCSGQWLLLQRSSGWQQHQLFTNEKCLNILGLFISAICYSVLIWCLPPQSPGPAMQCITSWTPWFSNCV